MAAVLPGNNVDVDVPDFCNNECEEFEWKSEVSTEGLEAGSEDKSEDLESSSRTLYSCQRPTRIMSMWYKY